MEVVGVLDRKALVLAIELRDFGSRGFAVILADGTQGKDL